MTTVTLDLTPPAFDPSRVAGRESRVLLLRSSVIDGRQRLS